MDTQDISEDLNTTVGETQSTSSKCWAVLAPSSSSTTVPPKELLDDEVVIGRNSTCGVRLDDRRISSRHAKLYREPDGSGSYKTFIVDLSTNGTFLERKRISKNTPVKLNTGAEISLSPPDSNTRIAFLFQILDTSYSQPSLTTPTTPPTTANTTQHDKESNPATDRSDKRPHEEEPVQSPTKKQRLELEDVDGKTKDEVKGDKDEVIGDDEVRGDIDKTKGENKDGPNEDKGEAKGIDNDEGKPTHDGQAEKESTTTKDSQLKEKEGSEKEETDKKVHSKDEKIQKDSIQNKEEENKDKQAKDESKQAKSQSTDAEIEEHLVCGICQSLFHKCVSVIPCLHNFCAYCIGEWCQRSNKCPECRQKIKGASKNHIINNVVGGFLAAHPDKCRPRSELDDMDANCKLTDQMLQKGKLTGLINNDNDDNEEDEEEEYSGSDEEDEIDDNAANVTCRQCRAPGADGFQCPQSGPHLMCSSCNQLVPVRPPSTDPLHPIPKVRCELCQRIHCDLYWGCPVHYGKGALKPLIEYQFTTIPAHLFMNNAPELQYTLDILTFNHIAGPNGMWQEILKDLDAGKMQFNSIPTHVPVTSAKISCQSCARTVFESLAYNWRAAMPADKVPPLVANRPNCHWGKNCRTQQHKTDHATRFNHVCEQTKF